MPTKNRVAIGDEVALVAEAERLKRLGDQNFEKVYGPKTAGFNITNDVRALKEVKMVANEQVTNIPQQQVAPVQTPVQPVVDEQMPKAEVLLCPHCGLELPNFEQKPDELSSDPETRLAQIAERLKKLNPSAPSAEQIKAWKGIHGDVFVLSLGERVFLYRYLKRQEYIQFNATPNIETWPEHVVEEKIFEKCVLWPRTDAIAQVSFPAGLVTAVVQQVRLQSLFLDPSYVAQWTFKI